MPATGTLSREQVHDLLNPLATIRGFAELLLVREMEPEDRRRYLELVVREAKRLEEALRGLRGESETAAS